MASIDRLHRSDLGRLHPIGAGGQGRVFRAPDLSIDGAQGPFVYKEYKRKNVPIGGLDGIALFRARLPEDERAKLDTVANWPQRVVQDDAGQATGVIMPLIAPGFFHELRMPDRSTRRVPRDGQYLAQPAVRCRRVGLEMVNRGDRLRFCRDLAYAMAFLHKREVCFGDVSFGNVTYDLTVSPCVYLVDCDALRLKGGAAVVPQLHTPDWIPPGGSMVQSEKTDRYKLGLYILRVLAPREMASQNRDPSWADPMLNAEGRRLLRAALSSTPAERTPAKAWVSHLKKCLASDRLELTRHVSRMPTPKSAIGG